MPAKLVHHKLTLETGEAVEWKAGDPPAAVRRKGKLVKVLSRTSIYSFFARALKKA